jgi:ubiquinone/menaquinone biosynthesis C-methylase UbiE
MKQNYLDVNYSSRRQNRKYDQKLVSHLLQEASREALAINGGKVLDLACGTGGFRDTFQGLGFVYFGADIDNYNPEMNIVKLDIGSQFFPYADSSFELVFFKMGIEHLTLGEIAHCLSEIKRVLKPQGAVMVLTPNWEWMYKVFYNEYTHQTPFAPESMRSALEMNGLSCSLSVSFIQLPMVWKYSWLQALCNVAQIFYPIAKQCKFVRYSRERIVFGLATKTTL